MRKILVLLLFGFATVAFAQEAAPAAETPAWMTTLANRRAELSAQNGPGTNKELAIVLLAMQADDQKARGFVDGAPVDKDKMVVAPDLAAIDRRLTAQLKAIVLKNGWPTIHLVGMEASNAAMLVLTHSADHAWQRSLLPKLEALAAAGKIDGSALALVVDKELVSEGKLQRYGTQFKFQDGAMMMYAVEDPDGLDKRREAALLMPMDVYRKMLSDMYHLPASEMIVRATPVDAAPATPAKKPATKKPATKKKKSS